MVICLNGIGIVIAKGIWINQLLCLLPRVCLARDNTEPCCGNLRTAWTKVVWFLARGFCSSCFGSKWKCSYVYVEAWFLRDYYLPLKAWIRNPSRLALSFDLLLLFCFAAFLFWKLSFIMETTWCMFVLPFLCFHVWGTSDFMFTSLSPSFKWVGLGLRVRRELICTYRSS